LDFGRVDLGDFEILDFSITNTGYGLLSGTISESCEHFAVVGQASYSLTNNQSHSVSIIFYPGSEGPDECTINTGSVLCSDVYCVGDGGGVTGIEIEDPGLLTLRQNYPNPFNPATTIAFWLPEKVEVVLAVFDVDGSLVKTLVAGLLNTGIKEYVWDGTDSRGNAVSSGVYFYQLRAGGEELTKKLVILK
jgi:hypothetical protein